MPLRRNWQRGQQKHQEGVQRLGKLFADAGQGQLQEGNPDLVWIPVDGATPVILAEFKTIDGDADTQIRHAVGQLLFYDYFDLTPVMNGRAVDLVVAVDQGIGVQLIGWLDQLNIVATRVTDAGWHPLNPLAEGLAALLGPPAPPE